MSEEVLIPESRLVLVEELLPYARNSKTHPPAQIEALAGNMQRVGFTTPLLIADGTILAGHGRLLAAKKLGLLRVPCIDLSHLSEAERRAQVIWDNRSPDAFGAGWDLETLKLETDELRAEGLDLELFTGFSEEDLDKLLEGLDRPEEPGGGDPDETPELPEEPVVLPGDTWICGAHRVHCGDATSLDAWSALLQGELVDLVVTDPPYGVDVDRKNRLMDGAVGGKRAAPGEIINDKLSGEALAELLRGAYRHLFDAMKPGATIYVAHSDKEAGVFRAEFDRAGFTFSQNVIWKKDRMVLGMARYQPIHEPIIVGRKPGSKSRWFGGRKQTTVMSLGEASPFQRQEDGRWAITVGDQVLLVSGDAVVEERPGSFINVPRPAKSGLHQSQKPVELFERLMRNSARPNDIVADAFGGSGSMLIAAERMGMCARVIELSPDFCEVILRRYWAYTGRRPVHAVTGMLLPLEGEPRARAEPPEPTGGDDGEPF